MMKSSGSRGVACMTARRGSKVIITLALNAFTASVIPSLLTSGPTGPIANRVTTQDQDQDKGRLLEEAKRDLEAFKNAYYRAERDMRDLEGRYEKERQALNDEIRWLRECGIHCREERLEGNHCSGSPSPEDPPLLIRYFAGVVIGHVATQCRCQGLLLGEAKRDLEALKKAHYKAERDMENLGERFERELQSANYEIRQLKVRFFTPVPDVRLSELGGSNS